MTGPHVPPRNDDLRDALKRAASAFKAHGPRFALAGSYALWAYGAPEPVHDVDFVVAEADAEAAEVTLRKAGFQIVHVPEDWLFKAYPDDDVLVGSHLPTAWAGVLRGAGGDDTLSGGPGPDVLGF